MKEPCGKVSMRERVSGCSSAAFLMESEQEENQDSRCHGAESPGSRAVMLHSVCSREDRIDDSFLAVKILCGVLMSKDF